VGKKSLLASAAIGLAAISTAGAASQSALAVIDVKNGANGIEVVGRAIAITDAKLSGTMVLHREGPSGSVTSSQGSDVDLAAGQSADIARVNVNFEDGSRLDIKLTLKQGDVVIAESTLTSTGQ
jgi:hypothetical protein